MSLFKEPFDSVIKQQLEARQNLIGKQSRNNFDITYLNSKTAWIQLRSSVDVSGSFNPRGLATDNVLLGGTLTASNTLKAGIGNPQTKAYSNESYNKSYGDLGYSFNTLGIKPMPGITNISIQNKGAYGSLRQATVNFQCWDIAQLNLLEQLYMRPGYTVLLEWGWAPYLSNSGKLEHRIYQDTDFFGRKNINIQDYLSGLRAKTLASHGNYDAMFGYVMNYSWKYRNDGGFDCTTEIISTGEILESYKINFSGAQAISNDNRSLLLGLADYDNISEIQEAYYKNIIAGLISETYSACRKASGGDGSPGKLDYTYGKGQKGVIDYVCQDLDLDLSSTFLNSKPNDSSVVTAFKDLINSTDTEFTDRLPIVGDYEEASQFNPGGNNLKGSILDNYKNIYITLESFVGLLNNFVLLENPETPGTPLVKLSVNDRADLQKSNIPLHCLYHNLQISVDPRVCIISNPLFGTSLGGIKITDTSTNLENGKNTTHVTIPSPPPPSTEATKIANNILALKKQGADRDKIILELNKIKNEGDLASISDIVEENTGKNLKSTLFNDTKSGLFSNEIIDPAKEMKQLNPTTASDILIKDKKTRITEATIKAKEQTSAQIQGIDKNIQNIFDTEYYKLCNVLPQKFVEILNGQTYGNQSNIYINLRLLYALINSDDLKSQDPSEKQGINLMSYLKDVLTFVQNATGNVNNFEIIIDGNTGYISDVNYVPPGIEIDAFSFEIGSNKTIAREASLESQIFSDQSTIIAISAQSNAGKLGLENSSMVAFNTGITDRMISRKDTPISSLKSKEDNLQSFTKSIFNLSNLFKDLSNENGRLSLNVDTINDYKTGLNDVIAFYTGLYVSDNKYKSILPFKLSLTLDGIGGLVIGNVFTIDKTFIPQSYKGDGVGIELQYTVTNVKHEIGADNQWKTVIEGNPFIPDASFELLKKNEEAFNLNTNIEVSYFFDPATQQVIPQLKVASANINSPIVKQNLALVADNLTGYPPAMQNAILANALKESGGIPKQEYGYSTTDNARLRELFGSRLPKTEAELTELKRDNIAFYDAIYGPSTKIGLGNDKPGDAWKYRGGGYNQLTGKAAYAKYSKSAGVDLVKFPEKINDPTVAAKVNAAYMKDNIASIAKTLRISPTTNNQIEANQLVTQANAGVIKRDLSKGTFAEQYAKVSAYASNSVITEIVKSKK
jgi:putative chitinase